MGQILKYPGSKTRIADWICSRMPRHTVYLEPYFGSGSVFFHKAPVRIETINDLDLHVVNFFECCRNYPEELQHALELTPYARQEYNNAYLIDEKDSKVERARKFAVRCWFGFGCGNRYKNGFRTSQQSSSPCTTRNWNTFIHSIPDITKRLMNVQIECKPALELLDMYDTRDVFIYLDPPYLPSIRKKYQYVHEMSEQDHVDLLEKIVNHPAKIMISGYDNDLYRYYLKNWTWDARDAQAEGGVVRREVIWYNYGMEE